MVEISFHARIVSALGEAVNKVLKERPDSKHNIGRFVSEAFLWQTIADMAKKKEEDAWAAMEANDVVPDKEERKALDVGERILAESPKFRVNALVTQPVRRFDVNTLAKKLKKFRVPEATTKQLVDQSKVPTTGQVRLSIVEK